MQKAIHIENSNKNVVRVLSLAEPDIIENNPTDREYILVEDYTEPPALDNPMSVNYPMWDKVKQEFKWLQIQYQNTVTEELLEIENLKAENITLNETVNMLIEAQADIIGGAIQ